MQLPEDRYEGDDIVEEELPVSPSAKHGRRQRRLSRLVSRDWFEMRNVAVFTSGGDSQGNRIWGL